MIRAYWDTVGSIWGNSLSPWLLERIYCNSVAWEAPEKAKIFGLGSIINKIPASDLTRRPLIWGSGILSTTVGSVAMDQIRAVRGPLTAKALKWDGVMGDPALLLSRYEPPSDKKYDLGIVVKDKQTALRLEMASERSVAVIHAEMPVETVLRVLTACQAVMSTTLYGIIVAQAYAIPWIWADIISDPAQIVEDNVGFHDFALSLGIPLMQMRIRNIKLREAVGLVTDPQPYIEKVSRIQHDLFKVMPCIHEIV